MLCCEMLWVWVKTQFNKTPPIHISQNYHSHCGSLAFPHMLTSSTCCTTFLCLYIIFFSSNTTHHISHSKKKQSSWFPLLFVLHHHTLFIRLHFITTYQINTNHPYKMCNAPATRFQLKEHEQSIVHRNKFLSTSTLPTSLHRTGPSGCE